ncbi:MAG TPA: twin-arginine translocation signal domain-containing protein [bacterium]|nr:twin-arginine translocation signal domain-containing protein [bacterium]
MSRRTLLGAAAGACAAAALGVWRWLHEPGRPASTPVLEATAPGPVTGATVSTLVAAARAVIGKPIEPSHYAEYFRWRAEHLPGYRTLYERFTARVDRDARRTAGCAFAACGAGARARVLGPASRARDPRSVVDAAWMAAGGRVWAAYDRFILNEALALFAETDAWVLTGYAGWPGTPRGLDRYRRAR